MQVKFGTEKYQIEEGGLPLFTYAPRQGGWAQASYTFLLRITCKKGSGWVQISCKIAYVLNGRPQGIYTP